MFETNSITKNEYGKTKTISKVINLGEGLDLFISGASKDSSILDYLLNKILDCSIDRISKNNTYKDFSHSLEHINAALKATNKALDDAKIHMVIGVLNEKDFLFSNIGKSSCYLVKKNSVVEITDPKDKKSEFSFISNGELEDKDIITMSTKRLMNFLSESDFIDSHSKKITKFNDSINSILEEELSEKNVSIVSFSYKGEEEVVSSNHLLAAKAFGYKILDTTFVKRMIALGMIAKERMGDKSKLLKMILFALGIIIAIVLLYVIIGKTVQTNTVTQNTEVYQQYLDDAKISLRKASESTSNKDIFELNISKTDELVGKLEKEGLFLEDIIKIKETTAQLKKSFNGIESFEEDESKKVFSLSGDKTVKVVGVNNKMYVIGEKSISGPIIEGKETKKHVFDSLGDDKFIDATNLQTNIALITQKGKVVVFSSNGNFKFSDVIGQDAWEKSNIISSYASKIYLISKEENQIYKHKKSGSSFSKGTPYLKKDDQTAIGSIIDIAIDGGFYILKKDLSFVKFFSSPTYRLESLVLNKLPENYKRTDPSAPLKIKTRQDLNYVYMLLDNKIYVFKPNSRKYRDTKSLTYVGQVEGSKFKIIDFYIKHDGELMILNTSGIYKMSFEISDDKLLVR
ncbi:hypothetical protein LR004_03365 [Candidatus Gracilibacteria bacterium]|nr:hypothetical protein [Candidatus Gracilibacteria bacterium]